MTLPLLSLNTHGHSQCHSTRNCPKIMVMCLSVTVVFRFLYMTRLRLVSSLHCPGCFIVGSALLLTMAPRKCVFRCEEKHQKEMERINFSLLSDGLSFFKSQKPLLWESPAKCRQHWVYRNIQGEVFLTKSSSSMHVHRRTDDLDKDI